jgi:hypothetical protein
MILKSNSNYATQWRAECVSHEFASCKFNSNLLRGESIGFDSHISRCQAFLEDQCWFYWDLFWKN